MPVSRKRKKEKHTRSKASRQRSRENGKKKQVKNRILAEKEFKQKLRERFGF